MAPMNIRPVAVSMAHLVVWLLLAGAAWLGFGPVGVGAASHEWASAQRGEPTDDGIHRPFTDILDFYVRDGLVYYRALQMDRAKLDRYIASIDLPAERIEPWSRAEKMAYWINAYNALVLRTVVDHYPIRGRSPDYPANSIRQIPGAFDQRRHRAGGRSVTLDEIEKAILPGFGDPRALLVLGRGTLGSTRLRSEAIVAPRLDAQLASATAEFGTRQRLLRIDQAAKTVAVSPILSWHEAAFVAAYADGSGGNSDVFASRSPIERALLAMVEPHLLPLEQEFVRRNQFRVVFQDPDWRLNDLTGGRVD
jgi:hypothetical protein